MKLPGARSIRQKLNFILTATTLLALLLAGTALVAFDLRGQLNAVETDTITQADIMGLVSGPALAFDDAKVGAENLRVLRAKPNVAAAALFATDGRLFASFISEGQVGAGIPGSAQANGVEVSVEWIKVWRPVMSGRDQVGTVYLQARHDLLSRALEYLGVLTIIMGSSLVAAVLLSNRLQNALTAPIVAISDIARQIQGGQNFSMRALRTTEDEIGDLVDVFNGMLDELGRRAETLEQANQALRSSDERYQLAVRGSSAGLWDWDMVAGTMFYSPRFKSLLGYSAEEFPDVPASMLDVMNAQDRVMMARVLRDHLSQDLPYQAECRLQRKSGEWRWFFVTGMAQRDPMGRAFRMAGSVVDVTERKMAEQVLQDANRAKDEFIATLAHELRNPLAPIRTGLEIIKKDKANGPPSQRARDTMERQLAHMIRLIDDLLDISRINSGKIRLEIGRVKLANAVDSAVDISRPALEARGHSLEVALQDPAIELMADPTRLAQALGNLLNNAAKYTPPKGHVGLKAWQDGAMAVIEVSDDGVGIPAEMLDNVFGLFTQVGRTLDRSQGGLGIGLYLVRSLVELHHGTVVAQSEGAGRGSRFTIRIPCLLQPSPTPAPVVEPGPPQPAAELKVLVVDDNEDAAQTLATVLEMTGRRCELVYDGAKVLAAAQAFEPDVILLDIGLPGMSGYEVARQLRADSRFARTVLIAVTGWGSADDRRRSSEAGFDQHLTKPIDLAALDPLLNAAATAPSTGS